MMLWESYYQYTPSTTFRYQNPHNLMFVGLLFYLEVLTIGKSVYMLYGLQQELDMQVQALQQKVSNYYKVITSTKKLG